MLEKKFIYLKYNSKQKTKIMYSIEETKKSLDTLINNMETSRGDQREGIRQGLNTFFNNHYKDGIYGAGEFGDLYSKFKDIESSTEPEIID